MTNEILTRECEVRVDKNSTCERMVRVSFSSEAKVTRRNNYGEPWIETLGHNLEEVNLSRLNNSAPVLYNHERGSNKSRIGVVERAWLENGKGYADLRISKRAEVEGIWQDIQDGILRNVSVAYQIEEKTLIEKVKGEGEREKTRDNDPDLYRVTNWTPIEISFVDIPADHTVGVGRNFDNLQKDPKELLTNLKNKNEETMTNENLDNITAAETRVIPPMPPTAPQPILQPAVQSAIDIEAIRRETLLQEEQRRSEIRNVFKPFQNNAYRNIDELLIKCLDDSKICQRQAKDVLLSHLGTNLEPKANEHSHSMHIRAGESEPEKFRKYVEEALAFRSGIADNDTKPTELYGYSLLELARKSLEVRGINTSSFDKREIVARSFTHSSSDFPIMLANNAHKSMLKGYSEIEEVFNRFTSTSNLSDFKIHTRVNMSEFGGLDEIPEGGEYKYGTLSEHKEQVKLLTYGKKFAITRQAIINDDMSAFTEIPRKMGRSAKRKIGDLVFGILTENQMMADGLPLFHPSHKNIASKGAALSVASIGQARRDMMMHKDISGNANLNIRPSLLVIPAALEDTARLLMTSETDPSQTNSRVINLVRNSLEIIVDARLDNHSTTAWYLLANPTMYDVIEVGYLDGNSNPYLEQQQGWEVDGVEFKVRIDAAAKALEWRTLFKNPGA